MKPKKITTSKAKARAWKACSKYIRYRDAYQGHAPCCTCGRILPIEGAGCIHAGHFIPGRTNALLYNEKNIHTQCYHCNCRKQGAWPEYYTFMEKTYGQEVIDELMSMRNDIVQMSATDHLEVEAYFKEKLEQLKKENENATVLGY